MVKSEPMSPADTTWLRMDLPANPMVIVGVLMLKGPVDLDRVERTLADRLLAIPRFQQRAESRAMGYWWAPDPLFSINRHIKRLRLPGKGGKAELQRFIADLASQQLDMAHPLWDFHIVEKVQGGAAVVGRIHHAIADGMALIGVILSLTDSSPDAGDAPDSVVPQPGASAGRSVWEDYLVGLTGMLGDGLRLSRDVWRAASERATRPAEAVREGAGIAGELAYLLFMPQDSPTRFKGIPKGEKRVAWTDPIALPEVKVVSRVLGCSINDMLLTAVTGSLRAYLAGKGDRTEGVEVRALVPVNLRGREASPRMGNQFGVVAVKLPVGIENPLARLYEIRRRMEELKTSNEAKVTLGLLMALGYAPQLVQDRLFGLLLSRASAVMTNVPGPQHPLYLGGARLGQVMFWVPRPGDIAMGVSIMSFDGQVQFGVITDAAVIPDPDAVIARFTAEFEQLLYYVLMEPWHVMPPKLGVGEGKANGSKKPRARKAKDTTSAETAPPQPRQAALRRMQPSRAAKRRAPGKTSAAE